MNKAKISKLNIAIGILAILLLITSIQPHYVTDFVFNFKDFNKTISWFITEAIVLTFSLLSFYYSIITREEYKDVVSSISLFIASVFALLNFFLSTILVDLYHSDGFNRLITIYSYPMLLIAFICVIVSTVGFVLSKKNIEFDFKTISTQMISSLLVVLLIPITFSFSYETFFKDEVIRKNNENNRLMHLNHYEEAINEFSNRGFNEYFEWFEGNDNSVMGGVDGLINESFGNYSFDYYSKHGIHWKVVAKSKDLNNFYAYDYDTRYSNTTYYVSEDEDDKSSGSRFFIHTDHLTNDVLDEYDQRTLSELTNKTA